MGAVAVGAALGAAGGAGEEVAKVRRGAVEDIRPVSGAETLGSFMPGRVRRSGKRTDRRCT